MRNVEARYHPDRVEGLRNLSRLLQVIQETDEQKIYEIRNRAIFSAVGLACALGMACGVRIDPIEPEWPAIYIELPTGQVSWHLPVHAVAWDGHTTEEKYARIAKFIEFVTSPAAR